jgi:pyrroline-5-carboxylate reductase
MTAFAAASAVGMSDIRKVENLINSTGRAVFLEEESLLDAVTGLSGSGPAYFFYLIKAMIDAGVEMGFEPAMASLLVKQTMLGSYHLMQTSDKTFERWYYRSGIKDVPRKFSGRRIAKRDYCSQRSCKRISQLID